MTLPEGVITTQSTEVRERVDQIRITRPAIGDVIAAPSVEVDVTVMHDSNSRQKKTYKLDDAERLALWNSVATLTFKNWVMNQICPKANTLISTAP